MADVRDYFPYAPEKCLRCPALQAAADNLERDFELATSSSEWMLNPPDESVEGLDMEEVMRVRGAMAKFTTAEAVRRLGAVRSITHELIDNCFNGALDERKVVTSWVRLWGTIRRREVATLKYERQCRSSSPMAAIVPTVYSRSASRRI